MSLRSAAQEIVAAKRPAVCAFGAILGDLDEDDRAVYDEMIADDWSNADITKAFNKAGHKVGRTTVNTHMAGTCPCPR